MSVYGVLLPLPFDDVFDYKSDCDLDIGQLVEVPFGREELVGIVWKKGKSSDIDDKKIKKIINIIDLPKISNAMMSLDRKSVV